MSSIVINCQGICDVLRSLCSLWLNNFFYKIAGFTRIYPDNPQSPKNRTLIFNALTRGRCGGCQCGSHPYANSALTRLDSLDPPLVGSVALRLCLPAEQALCGQADHQRTRSHRTPPPPNHPTIQPSNHPIIQPSNHRIIDPSDATPGHDRPPPRASRPAPRASKRASTSICQRPPAPKRRRPAGMHPATPPTFAPAPSFVNTYYTHLPPAGFPGSRPGFCGFPLSGAWMLAAWGFSCRFPPFVIHHSSFAIFPASFCPSKTTSHP